MYDYRGGLVWDIVLIVFFIVIAVMSAPDSKYSEPVTRVTQKEATDQACRRLWERYPDMREWLGDCNG